MLKNQDFDMYISKTTYKIPQDKEEENQVSSLGIFFLNEKL